MARGDIESTKIYLGQAADNIFSAGSLVASAFKPDAAIVRGFQQSKNGYLPSLTVDGLANYSKASGYVGGLTTLEWKSYELTKDRARRFVLDSVNIMQEEGQQDAGYVLGEFIRQKVVPEVDANAIASVAQAVIAGQGTITSHVGKRIEYNYTPANTTILGKLITMLNAVKARTGIEEGYHILVNADYRGLVETSTEMTKTKAVNGGLAVVDARTMLLNGEPLVFVPASRMYSKIDLYDGTTDGEQAGGYIKDGAAGQTVVAMVVKDGAAQSITAHEVTKVITDSEIYDGTVIAFRAYYDTLVPANKLDGCEVLIKESES